jgi:hypothetical protein
MAKTRRNFSISQEYLDRLARYSAESGVSQAELVRRGIDLVVPAPYRFEVRESGIQTGGRARVVEEPKTYEEGVRIVDEYNRRAGLIDAYELWAEMTPIYPELNESIRESARRFKEKLHSLSAGPKT